MNTLWIGVPAVVLARASLDGHTSTLVWDDGAALRAVVAVLPQSCDVLVVPPDDDAAATAAMSHWRQLHDESTAVVRAVVGEGDVDTVFGVCRQVLMNLPPVELCVHGAAEPDDRWRDLTLDLDIPLRTV